MTRRWRFQKLGNKKQQRYNAPFGGQLVAPKVNSGHLQYFSDTWLDEYGYYVHTRKGGTENKALRQFLDWLIVENGVS